jgi:hypothetical protein
MASTLEKISGFIGSVFQWGVGGPKIKANAGAFDHRNAADSAYAIVRGATPVGDNDLVTKFYADTLEKPTIIKRQADCSAALPPNTGVRGFVVVSTAGTGAAIGDILYDNGTSSGTMSIVAATEGRCLAVTVALSGGTATFTADSIYIWDLQGPSWLKIGDIGSVTGAIRMIRYTITNAASQDSASTIPASCRVVRSRLEITTPYSAGATISIGQAGALAAFMATTDNDPVAATANDAFEVPQDTVSNVSALVIRTTIAGSPAAGAGIVTIWYVSPNA